MSKLMCGRIHLGPVRRTMLSVVCQCCGRPMNIQERATYSRIRFRVYEIMLMAQLANNVAQKQIPKSS